MLVLVFMRNLSQRVRDRHTHSLAPSVRIGAHRNAVKTRIRGSAGAGLPSRRPGGFSIGACTFCKRTAGTLGVPYV